MNSRLLFNLLHPSTSTPCSSVCSGSVTRACSHLQLPALPEVLSRSVQAHRTPGQDLKVRRTLVSHSATCLLLRIVNESSHLPLLLCHFLSTIQILILCSVPSDAYVRFPLRMLFILQWSRLHATIVLQVFFPLATAHKLCLGHLLQCIGCSMLLCCTWFLISAAFVLFDVRLDILLAWCIKIFSSSFCCSFAAVASRSAAGFIMFFLLRSDFAAIAQLSVQRQDMLLDDFCSTLHGVSSSLHVTSFSWKATPPTGIPQSSGRCRGSRPSPSRAR